ncbi:MAG TPA: DUF4388 domain-containing protein [Thermoanaerobaculia bacterium]|jgi:cytoskeletal protein RodZ|nr:DUF4388 domain-containing protein [Thermoanaerobaculia bacterium]
MNLEGDIRDINVVNRLVELGREQFTGAIRFENDGIIKIIYFKGGDILSASTNDRSDSIDELLLRAGKVTREHVKQALAKRKESETLGDALLNLGFITRKELTWARRVQVIGVIRSIGAWPAGSYTIVADYLPKREEGTLFPLGQLITELIVTEQDRSQFDKTGDAVYTRAAGFDEAYRRLGLNQDADAIVAQIDGTRNGADVAAASGKDAFNVYKLLHAMNVLGLLAVDDKAQASPQVSFAGADEFDFGSEGVADAADVWGSSPAVEPERAPEASAPTVEIPTVSLLDSTPELEWDEEPTTTVAPAPISMPSWEAAPENEIAGRLLHEQPEEEPEPRWGFDDAQIEAARRASVPVSAEEELPMAEVVEEASKPNRWVGALIAAVVIVILGIGGYAGFLWWQGRQAASSANLLVARKPKPTPPPAPLTATAETTSAAAVPVPAPTATSAASTGPAATNASTTSTAPPAAAPLRITPAPAPATASAAPAPPAPAPVPVPAPAPANTALPRVTRRDPTASGTRLEQTPAGGVTITNSGSASSSSDPQRQKYDAMARDFAAKASGAYTIQFELVCEPASIGKALKAGGGSVWFIPTSYRGRSCYRVFWGRYDTKAAADQAVGQIPASLREGAAVVIRTPRG